MLKLYARKGAGSDAVEALLAVCNQPYDVEYLTKGTDGYYPPEFRKINPRGEVPTLVLDDGTVMTESAAVLLWLADAHPDAKLAPAVTSPLRPRYLRWMLFLAAAPYASALQYYYPHRFTTAASAGPSIKAKAVEAMERDFAILSDAIGTGPFILGQSMSAADIYATMLISWAADLPGLLARHPQLHRLCQVVLRHPAIGKVWQHIEF